MTLIISFRPEGTLGQKSWIESLASKGVLKFQPITTGYFVSDVALLFVVWFDLNIIMFLILLQYFCVN